MRSKCRSEAVLARAAADFAVPPPPPPPPALLRSAALQNQEQMRRRKDEAKSRRGRGRGNFAFSLEFDASAKFPRRCCIGGDGPVPIGLKKPAARRLLAPSLNFVPNSFFPSFLPSFPSCLSPSLASPHSVSAKSFFSSSFEGLSQWSGKWGTCWVRWERSGICHSFTLSLSALAPLLFTLGKFYCRRRGLSPRRTKCEGGRGTFCARSIDRWIHRDRVLEGNLMRRKEGRKKGRKNAF